MKLNTKRTVLVGFAFFLICAFWQIYDVTIAMTLTSKFGLSQTASGVVMALDNILALFMLPLFGGISDRCKSKSGRRTPFVRTGTILAVAFLMLLSLADNAQLHNIQRYAKVNDSATMELIYDEQKDTLLQTPEGVEYKLADIYTREEFAKLTTDSKTTERNSFGREVEVNLYTRHVVPARQACAAGITADKPVTLILFLTVPAAIVRPEVPGRDFFSFVTRVVYFFDQPNNLFPSLHVIASWYCWRVIDGTETGVPKWYKWFNLIFFLLVCCSILFVKQHVFVDVPSGILVAEVPILLSRRFHWERAGFALEARIRQRASRKA